MGLIAAMVGDRWRPGIGDPTVLGWATVAAYGVGMVLCVLAARRSRRDPRARVAPLWWFLAAMMLGLGINKQLDLQTWFSQVARDAIVGRGLYERRRAYQGAFIATAAAVGLLGTAGFAALAYRRRWPILPVAGATFLVGYIVVRAASFHHVDQIINLSIPGARLSSAIELLGIAIIAFAARHALNPRPQPLPPRPRALIEAVGRHR